MRDLLIEKNKLFNLSRELRNCSFLTDNNKQLIKVREQQDKTYKKYNFFDEYIKAKCKIDRR